MRAEEASNGDEGEALAERRGEDEEDLYGPQIPGDSTSMDRPIHKSGPTIPSIQDLELRRGEDYDLSISIAYG
jgi:hypothetical protein